MVIHFYFQCACMTMNNISTSDGLKETKKVKLKEVFNAEEKNAAKK